MTQDLPGIKSAKAAIIGLSLLSVGGVLFALTYRFSETIYVKGKFESSSQLYSLRSDFTAPVKRIHITFPSPVKKGELLLSFDCANIYRRLKDAKDTSHLLASEITRLEKARYNVDALAKDSLQLAMRYAELYEGLTASGAVSRMQALEYRQRARQSQIQRYQQSLEWQNRISTVSSKLIAINTEYHDLMASSKHCDLFSPTDGIATNLYVSNSELVQTGREILTIQKTASKDLLRLQLTPDNLKYVKPGVNFKFTVEGYPFQKYGHLSAYVLAISDTSSQFLQTKRSPDSNQPITSTFDAIATVTSPLSSTKQVILSRVGQPIIAEFVSDKKSFISIFSDQFQKIERSIKSIQSRF